MYIKSETQDAQTDVVHSVRKAGYPELAARSDGKLRVADNSSRLSRRPSQHAVCAGIVDRLAQVL